MLTHSQIARNMKHNALRHTFHYALNHYKVIANNPLATFSTSIEQYAVYNFKLYSIFKHVVNTPQCIVTQ